MLSKIWELRVKKFKNDFSVVTDRVDSEELNETVWGTLGAKFVELQRIQVEIMKNVLSQETCIKFCKATPK